jgi:RNA polymerase sigma-70 factor (ECF subfamily)
MEVPANLKYTDIKTHFDKEIADIVCRKVKHQDYCQDIQQEVYLKILVNLPKIEQADNMSAYLVRLTNNTIIDYYRKRAKLPIQQEPSEQLATDVEEKPDGSLTLADCCLRPMIESLPAIYRDALVMVELEGLKHKQFADKAGISLTNAKTRVQRAREKLKEIILQCCNYQFDTYGNIVSCCEKKPNSGC